MKQHPNIVIVDYGVGNLYSLRRAFHSFGLDPVVSEDADVIRAADGIILPGVGSFEAGMRGLDIRGLTNTIREIANVDTPMLGICLGAQLLLTTGYEFGEHAGLDIIPGKVVRFPELPEYEKIPQVGWNRVFPPMGISWNQTIFDGLEQGLDAYFVHSYILEPEHKEYVFGRTTYGGYEFCSAVKKSNIYGCQFHPEKSGVVGLQIIKNFITMVQQYQA